MGLQVGLGVHPECGDCPIRHRAVCARCETDELDAAREWMLLLGRKTAREKIASLIAIIARRHASLHLRLPGSGMVVDLPLTREEMADYLGLTLETVSRQMSALKKDGVIRLEGNRHVIIPDFDRLVQEAGDDADGGMLA